MRHAILTAEKNVWIQWISEQPGKNNNFGQLAYVKPFDSEVDRSQYYKEAEHPDYKYSPKTGRQTTRGTVLEGNNLLGGRLEVGVTNLIFGG